MSIMEKDALDMASALMHAYELGDLINGSVEVSEYLYWKQAVDHDPIIRAMVRKLEQKKELYEECRRFGHFHPNYHAALDEVKKVQDELDEIEAVRNFKAAEQQLDDLLYSVSTTIAFSVSETIKVPSNNALPSSGGCGSGGGCSGKCS